MNKLKRSLVIFSTIIIVVALFIVDYSALFSRQNLAPLLIILSAALNIILITMHKNPGHNNRKDK
ncbi:MAG: hypothetical protein RQ743_06460 [Bacteroidales bacterium]|nr:hypothetical protein [Bacteroidales bacterium]